MKVREYRLPILLVLLVLTAPSLLLAQSETGTITGTVTDQSGAVVPGVTVTLTSAAIIGGTRTDVTSALGAYKFIALPPGSYDLRFDLSGFRTVSREGIRITANFVAKVDIALSMQALAETVTVSGEAPTVDSKSTLIATSLDKGLLDNIPSGRDIWVLTEQVAGTVPDRYNVGGTESAQQTTLNVHGTSGGGQQDYSVNGLSMNWPGGAGQYTMFYFDYDSFEEVQVETAGAPAEISVGGLYMNMITKSGGSEFHGGFTGMWNPGQLQGNNVTQEMKDQGISKANPIDQIYDLQPFLGGPISKNIWFFGSYRRYVINNEVLGMPLPEGGRSTEVDVNHQTNVLAKVTAQVNPANKLMVQYYFNYQNRFYRREAAAYTEQKASWRQIEPAHLIQGQWTSILKKSLFLDVRFGYLHQIFPLSYQPEVQPTDIAKIDDVLSTAYDAAPYDQKNLATRHQANVALTYFKDRMAGTHDFKFGFEWMRCLNGYDYRANGSLVQHYYDGVPAYVDAYNFPLSQQSRIRNISFYVQDAWTASNRLTFNLGVRFENFKGYNPAQSHPEGRFFPAADYAAVQNIPNFNILVPRLGVAYDVKGDGRTAIKASFSRYAIQEGSRFPETLNPNAWSGQGMEWTDTNGDNIAQDSELGGILYRYGGASGITLDPNISRPYSDEFTAGVQHQLGTDLAVSATYYYRKNKNLMGQLNLAVPIDTGYVPVVEDIPGGGSITVYNEKPEFVGQVNRQITNQTQFWENYHGIEFTGKKRLSNRWQMLLGYTYSRGRSYYVEVPWNFVDANDPNNLINIDNRVQASDTPNILKLGGTYILPYDIQLSGNYRFYTGKPLTRTLLAQDLNQGPVYVPAEPRGTYRYPNVSLLDFRVSKVFAMSRGVRVEAMFNLFNAFNAGTVINQVTTLGPSYGQPVQILTPIVVGFGGRLTF